MPVIAAGERCSLSIPGSPFAGVLVAFESSNYDVLETAGSVQVCVDVTQPSSQVSLPISFSVTATIIAESKSHHLYLLEKCDHLHDD